MDLMNLLKQDENLGRFSCSLYCTCGTLKAWLRCCNLSVDVALNARFSTNGMWRRTRPTYKWREQAITVIAARDLYLLAATVWSFAHLPLGLSDRNSTSWVRNQVFVSGY